VAIKHLKSLKKAGLNNIHLLPTYDIATVNEDHNARLSIDDSIDKLCKIADSATICQQEFDGQQTIKSLLQSYDVAGQSAQALVSDIRQLDDYNWGYDPYHYTVPEGSYAVDAQGIARIVEFREMVQSLHNQGFRVIMDVVYNHTYAAGLAEKSVLDKIVPQYYHRLDPISGKVEQSTCCDNTATERVMMGKLMTDSLVVWARDYKIDGFRFDLMGHQPKDLMLASREAVRLVDNDTYFYGEGWNFGEVASNSQFVQASQLELGGSEIGTFTDRLRDAVRGGGNNTRDSQGIGNGLLTFANDKQLDKQAMVTDYNLRMDQLRVGLAGNLINFPLRTLDNKQVLGKDIPYGDQPTGYALDPADTINYVSKHDNQTLWDNSQYRLAYSVSTEQRVRMHVQSLSFALFAQGIPFIHMGSEFMRSKSFLRDSYDYGDWFNRVDFSKQSNFYNVGLPPAEKDANNWPLIETVLAGHQGRDYVQAKHIQQSNDAFIDLLSVRMSSPLFRLTDQDSIIKKVSFLNSAHLTSDNNSSHQSGLLVMKIDDTQGQLVDNQYRSIVVIFNTSSKAQTFSSDKLVTNNFQLHPIQQQGADLVTKQSSVQANGFTVPALTSAVFVAARD
jgi:pullulanase-type alpha-1,6-glucosidase